MPSTAKRTKHTKAPAPPRQLLAQPISSGFSCLAPRTDCTGSVCLTSTSVSAAAKTPSALHAGSCPPVSSTAARIQRDLDLSSAKPQLRKTKISQNPPSIHRHKPVPPDLDPPFALLEFHCKFNIYRSDLSIPREMSNSLILLGLKIRGGRTGASIRFSLCTASKRKIIASGFLKGRSKNAHKIQLK